MSLLFVQGTPVGLRKRWGNSLQSQSADIRQTFKLPHASAKLSMQVEKVDENNQVAKSQQEEEEDINKPMDWEVLLPEPPLPKEQFDPAIGTTSGVVASDELNETSTSSDVTSVQESESNGIALTVSQRKHKDWLQSILNTIEPLPSNHPFAEASKASNTDQAPPTRKVEDWRFTDLRPVFGSKYIKPSRTESVIVDAQRHMDDGACAALVFINGVYSPDKSLFDDESMDTLKAAGGTIGSLDDLNVADMFSRDEFMGNIKRKGYSGLFPAINTAMATSSAVVDIPDHFEMKKPVVVLCITTGGDNAEATHASAPRISIRAGTGSNIHLLEVHKSEVTGNVESHSLALAATSIVVGDEAKVRHCFATELSEQAQLISQVVAEVGKKGNYICTHLLVGGRVARLEPTIELCGEEAHGECIGASVATNKRVTDLHSRIIHATTNTTSKQLQKNIATDRARAVFSGRVIVPQGSDGTDADQLCRSLLLSDKAQIDAMPVLEISTDDVKATHGATVSDLQPDEVFYCQSRGLSVMQTRTLLISGFVREVLGDCPLKYMKEICQPVIDATARSYQETKERQLELSSI